MPVETFGALPLALVSIANNEGRYLILGFDFLVFFFFFFNFPRLLLPEKYVGGGGGGTGS